MAPEPPQWRGERRVLLRGGSVYSPADPFATAMLVAGHQVAWIGSEGAALAMSDGVDEVVDLEGALVAPAFVDAHCQQATGNAAAARDQAAGQGIGLRHVVGPDAAELRELLALAEVEPGPLVLGYLSGSTAVRAGKIGSRGVGIPIAGASPAGEVAEQMLAATAAGIQVMLLPQGPGAMEAALAASAAAGGGLGGHRIEITGGLAADQVRALATSVAMACLAPTSHAGLQDIPLAALAAAGVPLSFGSAAAGPGYHPWATIAASVNHSDPQQRISTRAAFAAHTRGGWRAAGIPGVGTLVPGAPAHYVIWDVGDLVVQAPDDRIQAWSTDPRSGTPGLPDMSPAASPPTCRRTAVWGRTVFTA